MQSPNLKNHQEFSLLDFSDIMNSIELLSTKTTNENLSESIFRNNQKKKTKQNTFNFYNNHKQRSMKKKSFRFEKQYAIEPFFQFPSEEEENESQFFSFDDQNKKMKEEPVEELINNKSFDENVEIDTYEKSFTTEVDERNNEYYTRATTKMNTEHLYEQKYSEEESSEEIFSLVSESNRYSKEEQEQEPEHEQKFEKKRSVPIPINYHSTAFLSTDISVKEVKHVRIEYTHTFIQPHKYVESIQTEVERELIKSFNVPLKRVPLWKI
ncbi:hypothetical protein M0812_18394 [Anaeramoeba flamelloides]|uniref:Uncharacterized protein n=1 Tax=Anaeramoeba flamelloides TaxID=1746091 RepID=A0AAV7Z7N4_9EUKA|nr:hypothetical protein M0812_18394 [Anaeramoeba flamelloides]